MVAELARATSHLAEAWGREDLAARCVPIDERLADSTVRILLTGSYKSGKSMLGNALAAAEILPVSPEHPTIVPTALRTGAARRGQAVLRSPDGSPDFVVVDLDELASWATDAPPSRDLGESELLLVEVTSPEVRLAELVVLIDLPGAGGLAALGGAAAVDCAAHADAVIIVTDAGRPLTADEFTFVQELDQRSTRLLLVKSRIDIHPRWRDVVEADTVTVGEMVENVVGVSAELGLRHCFDLEDGLAECRTWLTLVVRDAVRRDAIRACDDLAELTMLLREPVAAALGALTDPSSGQDLAVERARDDLAYSRSAGNRWAGTLNDTFADLTSHLDHGMRESLRTLARDFDDEVAHLDPAQDWPGIESELLRRSGRLVAKHLGDLDERVAAAARLVMSVADDHPERAALAVRGVVSELGIAAFSREIAIERPRGHRPGLGARSMTLLRSSYSSALLVGFVGSVAGFAVAAPALLAVGVAMGSRGLRREDSRLLDARRAEARAAIRRHIEEFSFALSKETKDRVRRSQRVIRDSAGEHVATITRTANETLANHERARNAPEANRVAEQAQAVAKLDRIDRLADAIGQVKKLLAVPPIGATR